MTNENQKILANGGACPAVTSRDLLASCVIHIYDDHVIIQERDYVEDGWFIKVIPSQVQLWEVPQYGGEPALTCTSTSIQDAYRYATKSLC